MACGWPAMDFSTYEDDVAPPKRRNPLVMVGAVATAGVLCAGLVAFKRVRRPALPCSSHSFALGHFCAWTPADGRGAQLADLGLSCRATRSCRSR